VAAGLVGLLLLALRRAEGRRRAAQDAIVYERPDQKEWSFGSDVSEDGRWLVISVGLGTDPRNRVFLKDLMRPEAPVAELIGELEARYEFISSDGSTLWFMTDNEASRGRVIAIDASNPDRGSWKEVIAQRAETLEGAALVGDHFLCRYLQDAHALVRVHTRDGAHLRDVDLPGIGTVGGFAGRRRDAHTFYSFASFATPGALYTYDIATGASRLLRQPKLVFDPARYTTEQVFYESKDGTRIPMFLAHRADVKPNGSNPTLLYGYGGFGVSLTPSFSAGRIAWMELGGVYAVANLRGGGEYGEEWHQAGTKLNKQNVFDDFIAAADWLVAKRWTSHERLAIQGGSNGGLLIGAVLNQRPDVCGAALPQVGVMDMLRYEQFTIGWAWASDFGSVKNAEEFEALRAYSPYHNVREATCYPPTLITTADHDDRVVPAHSFKYAAALQNAQACSNPVLIRIETRAGHGAGKPTSKLIEEQADVYAFLVRALGME
jgi:prolyl oligopeptidase